MVADRSHPWEKGDRGEEKEGDLAATVAVDGEEDGRWLADVGVGGWSEKEIGRRKGDMRGGAGLWFSLVVASAVVAGRITWCWQREGEDLAVTAGLCVVAGEKEDGAATGERERREAVRERRKTGEKEGL